MITYLQIKQIYDSLTNNHVKNQMTTKVTEIMPHHIYNVNSQKRLIA